MKGSIAAAVLMTGMLACSAQASAVPAAVPRLHVQAAQKSVREPGRVRVTVTSTVCVDSVQVEAHNADGSEMAVSGVTPPRVHGRRFTVYIQFVKADTPGQWYIDYADANSCSGDRTVAWIGHIPVLVHPARVYAGS